jgi:hypothetical protein
MKTRVLLLTLALSAGAFAAVRPMLVQEPEMPEVTEHHKRILSGVGDWEGTITMFIPGMPSEPMPAQEKVEACGPYWTTSTFTSDMGGMEFMGKSSLGYDSDKKQYVGTWIDSTTTNLTVMSGEFDAKKNMLITRWKGPNWTGDGAMVDFRNETVVRADASVSTFYAGDGEGTKHMEIKLKRKAAKAIDADAPKK